MDTAGRRSMQSHLFRGIGAGGFLFCFWHGLAGALQATAMLGQTISDGKRLRCRKWPLGIAVLAMLWSGAALALGTCEGDPNTVPYASCLSEADLFDVSSLDTRTPLILIHGIQRDGMPAYPDYHAWDNLLEYMALEKQNNIPNSILSRFKPYKFEYYSNRPGVQVMNIGATLGRLLGQMDSLRASFNGKPIAVVAHSMGGLIARSYMEEWSGGERVLRLITLGTPHHGSPLSNGPAFYLGAFANLADILTGAELSVINGFWGGIRYDEGNRQNLH